MVAAGLVFSESGETCAEWYPELAEGLVEVNAPSVQYEGKAQQLCAVAEQLTYSAAREVSIKGKKAIQWVAETQVILTRPAQQQKHKDGKRVSKTITQGEPLPLRLIVSRILDDSGNCLAEWLLLSNVSTVDAQTLALWYYTSTMLSAPLAMENRIVL
jgi:hypothetical protein